MKRKYPKLSLSRRTLWNVYLSKLVLIPRSKENPLGIPSKGYVNTFQRITLLLTDYWRGYTLLNSFLSIFKMREQNFLSLMKLVKVHIYYSRSLGFGTSPFCNYSYAPIGEKAIKYIPKIPKNITCCATIS